MVSSRPPAAAACARKQPGDDGHTPSGRVVALISICLGPEKTADQSTLGPRKEKKIARKEKKEEKIADQSILGRGSKSLWVLGSRGQWTCLGGMGWARLVRCRPVGGPPQAVCCP